MTWPGFHVPHQTKVACKCGHVGTLDNLRWWGLTGTWSGECRKCGSTLSIPDKDTEWVGAA